MGVTDKESHYHCKKEKNQVQDHKFYMTTKKYWHKITNWEKFDVVKCTNVKSKADYFHSIIKLKMVPFVQEKGEPSTSYSPSKLLLQTTSPVGVLMKAARGTILTSSSISAMTEESLSSSFIVICTTWKEQTFICNWHNTSPSTCS